MLTQNEKEAQPYHHGNVKECLITAALQLIERNELSNISLRRLSKEVGVTPSAVYNHFSDKDALMLAIKLRLYEEFNRFFDEHSNDSADPVDALSEVCLAYYHFSQKFPSRFQFLFSSTLPLEWSTPEMVETSCHNLVRTRKLVFDIYEKFRVPCSEEDVVYSTLLIWSQLHGIVTLKKSGSINAAVAYQDWPQNCALNDDEEVERLIRDHIEMTVNTISNSRRKDNHH